MNDSLGNSTKELMDHDSFVVLWDRIKSLLDNVATKCIHGEIQSITPNSFGNLDDLLRCAMLKATLDQKVAKTVNHEWISLGNDCLDNIILLLSGTDLELLLEEDRSLLVVVANDLVNNVLPVAIDSTIKESAVVERFRGGKISLALRGNGLSCVSIGVWYGGVILTSPFQPELEVNSGA